MSEQRKKEEERERKRENRFPLKIRLLLESLELKNDVLLDFGNFNASTHMQFLFLCSSVTWKAGHERNVKAEASEPSAPK